MHAWSMHAVVAAFHIYAPLGEDVAKRRGWIVMEISLLIMEKSWNHGFEFLCECCIGLHGLIWQVCNS